MADHLGPEHLSDESIVGQAVYATIIRRCVSRSSVLVGGFESSDQRSWTSAPLTERSALRKYSISFRTFQHLREFLGAPRQWHRMYMARTLDVVERAMKQMN